MVVPCGLVAGLFSWCLSFEVLTTGSVAISMITGLGKLLPNLPGCFRGRRMMSLSLSLVFVCLVCVFSVVSWCVIYVSPAFSF